MTYNRFMFDTITENNLINTLYTFHRGKENAIKSKDLARELNISRRKLRALTNYLLIEKNIPIASTCDAGIFYIVNLEEMKQSKAELLSRVRALVERADGTERAYNKTYNEEFTLF